LVPFVGVESESFWIVLHCHYTKKVMVLSPNPIHTVHSIS